MFLGPTIITIHFFKCGKERKQTEGKGRKGEQLIDIATDMRRTIATVKAGKSLEYSYYVTTRF